MDTCTIEVGLLRKKPCGDASVAKCANCEQALCNKHALPQLSPTGRKTGAFLCPECMAAHKRAEKDSPAPVAVPQAKPATPPPAKPVAAAAPKKEEPKKEEPKKEEEKKHDEDAPLEFTPSKPPEDGKK